VPVVARSPSANASSRRLRTARLQGMSEMARALGHEVNNLLAAVTLRVELLAEDVPGDGPARESVAVLERATAQGRALVQRVRILARLTKPAASRAMTIADAVDDALAALGPRIAASPGLGIDRVLAPAPPALADRAEVTLALVELLANAFDAAGERGRVRIETGADGGTVYCRIADDGPGLTEEARTHAFEPFFSTRESRGAGLGLTIALAVAARHDGDITLGPGAAGGTLATLSLRPAS